MASLEDHLNRLLKLREKGLVDDPTLAHRVADALWCELSSVCEQASQQLSRLPPSVQKELLAQLIDLSKNGDWFWKYLAASLSFELHGDQRSAEKPD